MRSSLRLLWFCFVSCTDATLVRLREGYVKHLHPEMDMFAGALSAAPKVPAASTMPLDLASAEAAVEAAKKKILADPLINGDTTLLGQDLGVENEADLVNRFVAAVIAKAPFVISFGGSSVTAGHDNLHKDAFPQIMADFLGPAMQAAGSKLTVRNQAMGGTVSTPYSLCLRNHLGDDTDIAVWEFSMIDAGNGGDGLHLKEYFLRNALQLSKQPAVLFIFADYPRRSEQKTKTCLDSCRKEYAKKYGSLPEVYCRKTPPAARGAECGLNLGLTQNNVRPSTTPGYYGDLLKAYKVPGTQ
jgi:hypothetical protein